MKKLVLSTDTIQRGGKERQLFVLGNQLNKKGYSVYVLSLKGSDSNYVSEYSIPEQCTIILNKPHLRDKFLAYKQELQKIKPDIVFSWDVQTALFSLLLSRKLNFKFINGSIQHGIRLFRFSHLFRSLVLWFSPYRLGNSLAGLKANNLRPGPKTFVLYNGIEDKFLPRPDGMELESRRAEMIRNYVPGSKVFISVANFLPYKDYFTVLDALSKVTYKFHYVILGDGPLRSQVEARVRQLGLDQNVMILGRVEEVCQYLRISDVMIHSSRGEGISNAILEAMFCGLPVITSNVGGTPELVFDRSFKLFDYRDTGGLLDILLNIEHEFTEFDPRGEDYKRHLAKFTVSKMTDSFEGRE